MDYPIYYGKKDSCLKHFETTVTNQSSSENVRTSHQLRQGSALHFLISWSRDFHWDEPRGFTTCLVIGFAVWIMCYIFIVINIYNYIYIYIFTIHGTIHIYIIFIVLYIVFWLQYTISNTCVKATGFHKTLVIPQSFMFFHWGIIKFRFAKQDLNGMNRNVWWTFPSNHCLMI